MFVSADARLCLDHIPPALAAARANE